MRRSASSLPRSASTASAVPAGAPAWVDEALLAETLRVWQPYYADPLTAADALAIVLGAARLQEAVAGDVRPKRVD